MALKLTAQKTTSSAHSSLNVERNSEFGSDELTDLVYLSKSQYTIRNCFVDTAENGLFKVAGCTQVRSDRTKTLLAFSLRSTSWWFTTFMICRSRKRDPLMMGETCPLKICHYPILCTCSCFRYPVVRNGIPKSACQLSGCIQVICLPGCEGYSCQE